MAVLNQPKFRLEAAQGVCGYLSPCCPFPLHTADTTLNHLFAFSWLRKKNKRLSSLLLMVTSAWPPNQMLVSLLWSPLLLTKIASCPRNVADVQQCIVMPGCSSTPISFKAHPLGWHQLGCCCKCTIYITPSFLLGMDLNWSLQKLSPTHPPWTLGRETQREKEKTDIPTTLQS